MVNSKEFAQKLYNHFVQSGQKERAEELLTARPQHIEIPEKPKEENEPGFTKEAIEGAKRIKAMEKKDGKKSA